MAQRIPPTLAEFLLGLFSAALLLVLITSACALALGVAFGFMI